MARKLFIGGLAWGTDEEALRGAFSSFGEIKDVRVIRDPTTQRSRGFGFVEFGTDEHAAAAKTAMDGADVDGRRIRVDFAQEKGRSDGPRGGGRDPRPGGPPRGFDGPRGGGRDMHSGGPPRGSDGPRGPRPDRRRRDGER